MPIPEKFLQTWKSSEVPEKWRASPAAIRQYHPTANYTLTTDADNLQFVKDHFPEYLSLYQNFPREIYRADMVRYMWLYINGGIYLDLDLKLKKSLTNLFASDADLYLVRTPNGGGYTNSFMASKPRCEFWLRCLEEIRRRVENLPWYIFGDWKVLYITGPGMITDVLSKYNRPFVTIPYSLGHPCTVCDAYLGRPCGTGDTYIEELEGSSWTGGLTSIGYFIYCRWEWFLVFLIILLLLILLVF